MGGGRIVALVLDRRAMPEDCARAFVVVTRLPARGACEGPALVLDGAHFAAAGRNARHVRRGWRSDGVERASGEQDRPWSRAPRAAATPGAAEFDPGEEERDAPMGAERID